MPRGCRRDGTRLPLLGAPAGNWRCTWWLTMRIVQYRADYPTEHGVDALLGSVTAACVVRFRLRRSCRTGLAGRQFAHRECGTRGGRAGGGIFLASSAAAFLEAALHRRTGDEQPWKYLPLVLALAFAARAAVALSGDFVLHPDEIMQYLEPAHRLAFGNGVIYWEYFYGARSWLVPGVVAGVLKLFDLVGLGQPWWYVGAGPAVAGLHPDRGPRVGDPGDGPGGRERPHAVGERGNPLFGALTVGSVCRTSGMMPATRCGMNSGLSPHRGICISRRILHNRSLRVLPVRRARNDSGSAVPSGQCRSMASVAGSRVTVHAPRGGFKPASRHR